MDLAKLTIIAETAPDQFTQQIEALFNPSEISIQQSVNWPDQPTAQRDVVNQQHTNADPATLSLDLFFDTYEAGSDVREHTSQVAKLAIIETHGNMHRPPVCKLSWGKVFFQGTLQSLTQRFTMFLASGIPVRATLQCTFKQWRSDPEEVRRLDKNSADVEKRYTVRRGDSLTTIAYHEFRDPKLWRPIADANHIENPRKLTPGSVLRIPRLREKPGGGLTGWSY
jgi:nucleoid-associated protein YgaU